MKKIIVAALFISLITACNKNKDATPPVADYKVKTAIHRLNGVVDTTTYTYSGSTLTVDVRYSNSPTTYRTIFTQGSGVYRSEYFTNGTKTTNGYYRIAANGYIDTTSTVRTDGTINNSSKYEYNSSGYNTRLTSNYVTYEQDYHMNYSGEDYSYWINNFRNFSDPSQNKRDSIVFEFYNKPQVASYKSFPWGLYGKPVKNLVKKRTYYNQTTGGNLYQTWEYEYETNSAGLVTREIWAVYNQPGNVLNRKDTTNYTW